MAAQRWKEFQLFAAIWRAYFRSEDQILVALPLAVMQASCFTVPLFLNSYESSQNLCPVSYHKGTDKWQIKTNALEEY